MMRALMALSVVLVGCGASTPPPSSAPAESNAQKDAQAEGFGETNPADVAELAALANGDGGAGATKSAQTPPPESVDECTPVGVDFEKRARPKLKECYATGKKKDPNLEGTVRVTVDIDMLGKIRSTKITEKTLPDAVAQCMLKVVKATPLPEASKCPGKALTIPMTFPTPR